MRVAVAMLALVATVTLFAGLARWRSLHAPLVLTVVGVAGSFLPFVPQVRLGLCSSAILEGESYVSLQREVRSERRRRIHCRRIPEGKQTDE